MTSSEHATVATVSGRTSGLTKGLRSAGVPLVIVVVVAAIAVSQAFELFVNRVLRPDATEWTWISEVVMAGALVVVTTLWVHLQESRQAVSALERERLVIQAELELAADVQRALLPVVPEPLDGCGWHAALESARQVGGDYYDFFSLTDGRMCVVVADVSGKGVPAAVFLSNVRALLHAVARETDSPSALLRALSDTMQADSRTPLYVTMFVALVDTARRTMTYANAGHPPGIVHGRLARALSVGGPPVGLVPNAMYDQETVALEAGELVVIVSDGITDALDVGGEAMASAVCAQLRQNAVKTPRAACESLLAATRDSGGPSGVDGWADDRTVVAFGWSVGSQASS
ncbi:MAG: PP2C family protein-serine/threonine phosphatase [Vicinamibacterales bacterium]